MATAAVFNGDEVAPFFGFIGAAAALVFSYNRHGRGVRDGEERGGSGVHGGDEAGAGDEVHRAGGDGGSAGHLRAHHRRHHQHRHQPQVQALLRLRRLRAPLLGPLLRPGGPVGRHGHRHRRRRRRQGERAAAEAVRGDDSHPDFCGGAGVVRADRGHHPVIPCRAVQS